MPYLESTFGIRQCGIADSTETSPRLLARRGPRDRGGLYGLNRSDLEWILDATPPSSSLPSPEQQELRAFGEYRTERLVLQAFDTLEQGVARDLTAELHE